VNATTRNRLRKRKRTIARRLDRMSRQDRGRPILAGGNIHYEVADRIGGIGCGGIGMIHQLARRSGLVDALDRRVHVLKMHRPYHESDHILSMAYNILAGGRCLEDLELLRNDE